MPIGCKFFYVFFAPEEKVGADGQAGEERLASASVFDAENLCNVNMFNVDMITVL